MQALSTRNDEPERASRPFDRDRDGFVMGEGAAIVVLEELEAARRRGAHIYAEVSGYGATADASHITAPEPNGDGARRCVLRALQRAHASPADVGYINAHGTGTQLNDAAETKAIKAALGEARGDDPDVLDQVDARPPARRRGRPRGGASPSWRSATSSCRRPSTSTSPTPSATSTTSPTWAATTRIDLAISTSFGFGGHNACLAFSRVD